MITEETITKMKKLKLHGMVKSYEELRNFGKMKELSTDEFLAHLVDFELDIRENNKIARILKAAKFRHKATFADLSFSTSRNLDKKQIAVFTTSAWLLKNENIVLTGPTGVGKSFIACAIGYEACMHTLPVLYFHFGKLMNMLKLAKASGVIEKELKKIQSAKLLILDDFGLEQMDKTGKLFLLEILEDRYGNGSTIITSQLPLKNWHDFIADSTIADAICDRIIHNSHRIELKGESLRKKISPVSN